MSSIKAVCDTCSAYMAETNLQGVCRAQPPTPIMVGVRPMPILQGIPGGTGGQEPVVVSYFPPMKKTGWCRAWEPDAKAEAILKKEVMLSLEQRAQQASRDLADDVESEDLPAPAFLKATNG